LPLRFPRFPLSDFRFAFPLCSQGIILGLKTADSQPF